MVDKAQEKQIIKALCTAGKEELAKQFARSRGYRVGGVTMPTSQLKDLMQIPRVINDAARKTDVAIDQLVDALQGGITPDNARRINKLVGRVVVESSVLDEMHKAIETIAAQLQKMTK